MRTVIINAAGFNTAVKVRKGAVFNKVNHQFF